MMNLSPPLSAANRSAIGMGQPRACYYSLAFQAAALTVGLLSLGDD